MKDTILILQEQQLSLFERTINATIQRTIAIWLTKELNTPHK